MGRQVGTMIVNTKASLTAFGKAGNENMWQRVAQNHRSRLMSSIINNAGKCNGSHEHSLQIMQTFIYRN